MPKRRYQPYSELAEGQRHRSSVRSAANVYQRRGILIPTELCEDCQNVPPTEKHHEDYNKPLLIKWLCHNCHQMRTAIARKARAEAEEARLCAEWERRLYSKGGSQDGTTSL